MVPYTFQLDAFQEQALAALERGASVVVSAPTGVGKTVVAEMAIDRALERGQSALYASPLKALSNQKYSEFATRYGSKRVGILTGDVQENPTAPLLVLTTEILHNRLVCGDLADIRDLACVVFDEFHYLSDPKRGPVWEESIILLPRSVPIVCLSATLPNIEELAGWLAQHVGHLEVIVETRRPVPLAYHYFADGELHAALAADGTPDRSLRRFDVTGQRRAVPMAVELLPALVRQHMTPALCFLFSRGEAERQASMAAAWLEQHAHPEAELQDRVDAAVRSVEQRLPGSPQAQALVRCLRSGAGFHHAGLLPELKVLVEQLFGEGLLRLLCATETFALGLNMPARTVALPRITKFDGRTHRELTAREFQQMAGRAGRRGLDEQGHVVLFADPWKSFSTVSRLLSAPLDPVRSSFSFSYNTLLNVSTVYGDDAAASILSGSFLVNQLAQELRHAEAELVRMEGEGRPRSRTHNERARRRVLELRGSLELGRHRKELDLMRSALIQLGYSGSAPKSELARRIFHPHSLPLVELLSDPRFSAQTLAGPQFAELIGWFAADPGRSAPRGASAKLNPELRALRQLLEDVTARVQRAERQGGMLLTKAVVPAASNLIYRWCAGDGLATLRGDYRLSEGDIGGQVDRTRRLVRQVLRATSDLPAYTDVAGLATRALDSLRDRVEVVDEEEEDRGLAS